MKQKRDRESTKEPSGTVHTALFLSSCIWCQKLHRPEHPLEFNPVCSPCVERRATLRLLDMNGCYPLNDEAIDRLLTQISPGNYALGYMDDAAFVVFYVGRSDSDVRQRLHEWVGVPSRYDRFAPAHKAAWELRPCSAMPLAKVALGHVGIAEDSSYTCFAYSYAPTAAAAFDKECRNYSDFGGCGKLDNDAYPVRTLEW